MSVKVPLYTVAVASTSFTTEAYLDDSGGCPTIRYAYNKDGARHNCGLEFDGACATRTRAERCCNVWHIEGAYDTLVEVTDSEWVAEVRKDMQEQWRNRWEMHHYMIYLDSAGCFEVIASSWRSI